MNNEGSFCIVLAVAVGGKREHRFKSGAALAKFCWDNRIKFFTDVPKSEQRD